MPLSSSVPSSSRTALTRGRRGASASAAAITSAQWRRKPSTSCRAGGRPRGGAHPQDPLGRAQQLHHPRREGRDVPVGHDEAVDAVGDLLARPVADVVGDDGAAPGHRLERRQRVALEDAREQQGARRPQRVPRARVEAAHRDRLAEAALGDGGLDQLALRPLAVDVEPRARHRRHDALPRGDRVHELLLRGEPGEHGRPQRVARGRRVRRGRDRHRVGDDVHVARAPAARGDLVALARGEGDEGVDVRGALEHALVGGLHRPVPAPRGRLRCRLCIW